MGETLGIAHNVFEKVAREKDRKERLKKFDEWQKIKIQKQKKIEEMKKIRALEASSNGSLAMPEDLDDPIWDSQEGLDDMLDMKGSPIRPPRSPRMTSTSLKSLGSRGASIVSLDTPRKLVAKSSIDRRHDSIVIGDQNPQHVQENFSKIESEPTTTEEVVIHEQPPPQLTSSESMKDVKSKRKLKCGKCDIL